MPTNTESLNRELFRLLSKYKPKPLDAEGKATPVPEEADIFKFEFTKDGEDYGTVYVTLDDERTLTVYFGDDVSDSPGDKTPGLDYDDSWSGLLHQLSSWRMTKGLRGFKTQNKDRVGDDMARRNHMRNKDKIAEGYYPMGKSRSYSDAVPSVKIVIEHSRVIEEGEQRYRNINRIFLENQDGERYLLDTKKPGIARVYARHIAEGGKVNDDRWSHIGNLCEEYQKMAGFVRATRNGQFNESAQALVNEGLEHYVSLRESLSRMTGKRGYNAYFESWTPPLMEDGTEENNLNELFVQETLDPRIESVMPILNRIHKKVSESIVDKEMNKLAEWADSLVEGPAVDANAKSPTGSQSPALAHYADQLDHDASVQEDEGMFGRSKNDKRYLDKFDPTEVMNISDDPGMKAHKTTGKGSLRTSKEDLEFAFGPAGEDDTWVLEFGNGLIATIYPQSNSGGMDWIIGGNHPDTEDFVHMAYSAALDDELEEGESIQSNNPVGIPEGLDQYSPVTQAITRRILSQHPDLLQKHGPEKVANAIDDVAEFVGDVEEIGSSDVSGWVKQVAQSLGGEVDEAIHTGAALQKYRDNRFAPQNEPAKPAPEKEVDEDFGTTAAVLGGAALGAKLGKTVGIYRSAKGDEEAGFAKPRGTLERLKGSWKGLAHPEYDDQGEVHKINHKYRYEEDLDANQKRVGQLGPTGGPAKPGDLVGANENFINMDAQAVTSEGEHTQHAMRGRNPGANEFEHDFEPDDKVGNIHDKISKMLKKLSKPEYEPSMKDTDLGSTVVETTEPWETDEEAAEREKKEPKSKDTKGKDGSEHGGHSRAKHLAKQAIPKEEVKEGQEDFDAILRIIRK